MDGMLQDRWDAVIFDFDGVLCDSNPLKGETFATLYADEGPAVQEAIRTYHRGNGGMPRREKLARFERDVLGRTLDEERLDRLVDGFAAAVEEAVIACTEIPGASEFLAAHAGRLSLFIISATPHEEMLRIVARRGMAGRFVSVHGSPPGKAETAAMLLARHGLRPDRVAFVGDAVQDYAAATALNLPFVGVRDTDGGHPFPDGTPTIATLHELPAALAAL
ncbi:HAD family hydrolase [Azospirillum sp. B506]|uniref:HAD family hydrolase n=1 Tax=Azospirillum sp. B506 TaxID=137721 RepID=UPI00034D248F|nr:HAD-IA family hydrolase [Azospirillum sp. B506]